MLIIPSIALIIDRTWPSALVQKGAAAEEGQSKFIPGDQFQFQSAGSRTTNDGSGGSLAETSSLVAVNFRY